MKTYKGFIVALIFTFLIGCAPSLKGKIFKETDNIQNDESIVYLYWTDRTNEKCIADFSIKANEELITNMKYGGYYKLSTTDNNIELETHVNFKFMVVGVLDVGMAKSRKISMDIHPGNIYFVRCFVHQSPMGYNGPLEMIMMQVDQKRGRYEIKNAKLLPKS